MSRTTKPGKRDKHDRLVRLRGDDEFCASSQRHLRGATEKILRRNRKLWVRLGNKRRRRHDRETVGLGIAEDR